MVTGVEDTSRAELPWPEMALCANPERATILVKLPEFDAQGLVDRPRSRSPEAPKLPGLDELASEETASSLVRAGGPGAACSEPQAGGGATAGSSRRTGEEGTTDSAAVAALGDRGKCPQIYIPVPDSLPSPSAVAAFPALEPHLVRMGPDSAPVDRAAAPPSPRRKRRREDSGPALPDPEFRLPAAKWQYRGTTTV